MKKEDAQGLILGRWYLAKVSSVKISAYEVYQVLLIDLEEETITLRDIKNRAKENKFRCVHDIMPVPENWVVDKISALNDLIWQSERTISMLNEIMKDSVPVSELPIENNEKD